LILKKAILILQLVLLTNCGGGDKLELGQSDADKYKKSEGPFNKYVIPANSISEDELWQGLFKDEDGFCSPNIKRRRILDNFWMLEDLDIRLFSAYPYHGKNSSGLALPSACEDSSLKNFYLVGEKSVPLKGNPHLKDFLITGGCSSHFEYASVLWPNEGLKLADKGLYVVAEGEDVEDKLKYREAAPKDSIALCEELVGLDQKVFEVPGIAGKIVFVKDGVYQYDKGECYPLYDMVAMKDEPSIAPKSLMGLLSIKNGKRTMDFFLINIKGQKTFILPYLPHLGSLDFEDWSEEIKTPRC